MRTSRRSFSTSWAGGRRQFVGPAHLETGWRGAGHWVSSPTRWASESSRCSGGKGGNPIWLRTGSGTGPGQLFLSRGRRGPGPSRRPGHSPRRKSFRDDGLRGRTALPGATERGGMSGVNTSPMGQTGSAGRRQALDRRRRITAVIPGPSAAERGGLLAIATLDASVPSRNDVDPADVALSPAKGE